MQPGTAEHTDELAKYEDHEHNEEVAHDLTEEPLPVKKRACTDIVCLLLIIANWGFLSFLGFSALGWIDASEISNGYLYIDDGHPELLYRGVDHNGFTCGVSLSDQDQTLSSTDYTDDDVDAQFADMNYLYYPNIYGVISVASGPDKGSYVGTDYAVCVSSCPSDSSTTVEDITTGNKWTTSIEQERFISWCFPTQVYDAMVEQLEQYTSVVMQVVEDLLEVYWIVLVVGIGFPIVALPIYLYLLESPILLPVAVWGTVYALVGTFAGLGAWLIFYSSEQTTDSLEASYLYGGWGCELLGALVLVVAICKRKQIDLAIGLIEEGAHAILDTFPSILFVLLLQVIGFVVFIIPFTYYALYLASGGDQSSSGTTPSYTQTTYPESYTYYCIYMVFTYFWTVGFLRDVGTIGVATIVSQWYFHPQEAVEVTVKSPLTGKERESKKGISNGELSCDAFRCMLLHSGTAAVGSFIIAVVETIRTIIAYAQGKAKQSGNKAAQYILAALQCCVWCLEKCLKFINKQAYIQTAVFGTGFMKSTYKSFFLILRNFFTIGALNTMGLVIYFVGKVMLSGGAGALAYIWLDAAYASAINSPIYPAAVVAILVYVPAEKIMNILDTATNTLLVCYVTDQEMHNGHARYARGPLGDWINKANNAEHSDKPGYDSIGK